MSRLADSAVFIKAGGRALAFAAIFLVAITSDVFADGSWTEKVTIKGDFRYRHQTDDPENGLERNRNRFRARIGIDAKLDDQTKLGFQLASGSSDPISTNQTLDEGFSSKQVNIDLAYFQWNPARAKGVTLAGGKIKNPFFTPGETEMIWDGDLNPEGIAGTFESSGSETAKFFITLAGFWVEENSSSPDAGLRAAQAGVTLTGKSKKVSATFGGSFYDYSNAKGYSTFYDYEDSFGNSIDMNDAYMYDYNLLEGFAQVTANAGSTPFSIFASVVSNGDADSAKTGFLVGASIGQAKKTGSAMFRYNYRKVERDAVVGAFTDSDFGGGGTDRKGHEIGLDVMASSKVKLGATVFLVKKGLENSTDHNILQLDANFKI